MRLIRSFPIVVWLSLLSQLTATAEDRFEVWLHNGQRIVGQSITPLYHQPDDPVKLDNKSLGQRENPLLALFCPLVPNQEGSGTWIEFTNGDVIPGKLTDWSPAQNKNSSSTQPEQLLVSLDAAGEFVATSIAVRPECIRRIWSGNRASLCLPNGSVNTVDGRQIVARALRFGIGGLECLTEKGVTILSYDQLRDAAFALPTNPLDAASDALWSQDDKPLPGVVRFKTSRGASLTCGNQVVQRITESHRNPTAIHLLPNWAVQTIQLVPDRLRWVSWHNARELPLTSLPHEYTLTTKAAQRWMPQKNRNVQGSDLRCLGISAAQGWGVHSGTNIIVELPAGAERFHAWVGLDLCTGRGGCARAKIIRDQPEGEVIWKSDFLLGGQAPSEINLDVRNCKSLVLVVEEAHENRPSGADPWDIRDHVDWLWPTLTMKPRDEKPTLATVAPLGRWIPALAGFDVSQEDQVQAYLRPLTTNRGFRFAIVSTNEEQRIPGIRLTKMVQVNNSNARLTVAAGKDDATGRHQHLMVEVNSTGLLTYPTSSVPAGSHQAFKGNYGERVYTLGPLIGQQIELGLRLQPDQYKAGPQAGVVIDVVGLGPLIADLPTDGKMIEAEVPLTSLRPTKLAKDWTWENGKSIKNEELVIKGIPVKGGTALPAHSEISLAVDPAWRRFVAVVGTLGPVPGYVLMTLQLDGETIWETDGNFADQATAAQLDIELPPDHKTLTIKINNKDGFVVLGYAGFMTK